MSKIIAIFSDMKGLQDAQDALQENGLGDEVLHVIDQGAGTDAGSTPVMAGSQNQDPMTTTERPGAPKPRSGLVERLGLPDGQARFVEDAIGDGGRALLVNADGAGRVEETLRPHAQRVVPFD